MSDDAATPEKNESQDAPPPTAFDPDPADQPDSAAEDPTPTQTVKVADLDDADASTGSGGPGGFDVPIRTDFPTAPTKGGLTGALVALGSGLLGAAVLQSATRSRWGDLLDKSTYAVGVIAAAGLLGLAVFAAVVVRRKAGGQARGDLVTWPGVVGILSLAPLIHVGLGPQHGGKWEAYLIGGLIAGLAALGYVVARRPAFVVTAIVGLGILYARVFDDTVGHSLKDQNLAVVVAVGVTAFVVIITVLGWFLPSRSISGVSVGVAGVVGVVGATLALLVQRILADLFGGFASIVGGVNSSATDAGSGAAGGLQAFLGGSTNPADYTGEVSWLFALSAILTVLWALAALVSDHSGFKVLAITLPVLEIPAGTALISVQHPSWWVVVLGAAGGVLLLAALFLARRKARKVVGL